MSFAKLNKGGEGKGASTGQSLDLSDFEPVARTESDPRKDEEIADRVARRHNLAEEPVGRVALTRNSRVTDNLFIKGPLTTLNRFRQLCNDHGGITYSRALELLLDHYDETKRS